MHLIVQPIAIVLSTIRIFHNSSTKFSVFFKLSRIKVTIRPLEFSHPIFFVILVITLKKCSILPLLSSWPVSLVFYPASLVDRSIRRYILAISMSFVIFPLTNVNIPVGMIKPSNSFSFSVEEFAIVITFIRKKQFTNTMTLAISPLAQIIKIFPDFERTEEISLRFIRDLHFRILPANNIFQLVTVPRQLRQRLSIIWGVSLKKKGIPNNFGINFLKWIIKFVYRCAVNPFIIMLIFVTT